ncbi:hypothetical protein I4U23_011191 [Adineta vaga]|nr:hypothetical protein I4U23_011191 [Adineta vaga]
MNSRKLEDGQLNEAETSNKTNNMRRIGNMLLSWMKSKTFLFGLLFGLLTGGIGLAAATTMWLAPSETTSTTTKITITSTISSTTTTQITTTTTTTESTTTTDVFTPSTMTCNSTVATPCTTTTTLVASCQSYEVSWNNHCYYLDGSGGNCTTGYSRAANAVLTCIASQFAGKTYRNTTSNNCCIWTSDTYECYIMSSNCNAAGPFSLGPKYGCTNLQQQYSQQMTFCGSN